MNSERITLMRKKPFLTILLCNLFASLTVLFFSPMEVILANAGEFFFPFANVWWFQLLVALAAALLLTGLFCLLPSRAGLVASALSLGFGLAAYVQVLFMNGHMVSLTGERFDITSAGIRNNLINWVILLLVVALAVFFFSHRSRKPTEIALRAVAAALTVMQLTGFIGSVVGTDLNTDVRRQEHVLTAEKQFELSGGQNTVVFVLDTADAAFAEEMLSRWPKLKDSLSGWVWYPNATSRYNRTYPALPYMFTAHECHLDRPVPQYVDEAWTEGMGFIRGLHDAGTDIRILTPDPELISDLADPYIDNSVRYSYSDFGNLDLPRLEKVLLRVALFKCMPYQFKFPFRYDMDYANTASFKIFNDPKMHFNDKDDAFAADLRGALTVTDSYDKSFRFYHLYGSHIGAGWDENLKPRPAGAEEDYPAVLRGCFRNIEDYISQMKALGIYDRSTIIVTADHGSNFGIPEGQPLERTTPACPLLMVKYPNADLSRPLQTNRAPVCQDDLFATIEQSLSAPASGLGSGKTLEDFTEGEARERYYDFIVYHDRMAGEIAVREYLIDGDAGDIANYHLTGRWWDVLYSVQPISDEPFP